MTCFMGENEISPMKWRDLMNIKETKFEMEAGRILLMSDWCTPMSSFCKLSELTSVQRNDSSSMRLLKPTTAI